MRKLTLPRISERIRGFTLPRNGEFFVFDYDEVFRVVLGEEPSIEVLKENPYEFEEKATGYFGVSDRTPILECGLFRVSYNFDPKLSAQDVLLQTPEGKERLSFQTLSGDWFVATLSEDAKFLFVAEPYLIEIYSLQ
jgi:hypothetical protein